MHNLNTSLSTCIKEFTKIHGFIWDRMVVHVIYLFIYLFIQSSLGRVALLVLQLFFQGALHT